MVYGKYRFVTILLAVCIAATLLIGVSGLPHMGMTMSMDSDGNMAMSDCYIPGMAAICSMTPLEHFASWQNMFASVVQQYGNVLILVLLAFAIIWYFSHALSEPGHRELFDLREKRKDKIFDPLRLALSRGLIHPKIF